MKLIYPLRYMVIAGICILVFILAFKTYMSFFAGDDTCRELALLKYPGAQLKPLNRFQATPVPMDAWNHKFIVSYDCLPVQYAEASKWTCGNIKYTEIPKAEAESLKHLVDCKSQF